MKCNLMAWLRKENGDIPAFPIGAPFRPKEVKQVIEPSSLIIEKSGTLQNRRWQPIEEELPDGVYQTADGYEAICFGCEEYKPIVCDVSEIPKIGYEHYCGGSPRCCP